MRVELKFEYVRKFHDFPVLPQKGDSFHAQEFITEADAYEAYPNIGEDAKDFIQDDWVVDYFFWNKDEIGVYPTIHLCIRE